MPKRLVPLAVALAAMMVVTTANRPTEIRAEDRTYLLKEQLGPGTVRAISGQRTADITVTVAPGTAWAATSRTAYEKAFETQEWIARTNGGRTSEVWRSYCDIKKQNTSYVDYGQGPQEITTPGLDVKASHTFMLNVGADGTRSFNQPMHMIFDETEKGNILRDTEAYLLPDREVKVGDSWKASSKRLGLIGMSRSIDEITGSDLTVTFKSVSKQRLGGDTIANLTIKGTVSFETKVASGVAPEFDTHLTSKSSFDGTAQFNVTAGRMLAYKWDGESEVSGKMNGSAMSSTGPFVEANQYMYATVIDRPVAPTADGPETATELKTFKHDAVDPSHVVIARDDGKIARVQVFDPATKKITKTLLVMPGANSINSLALSPDRKRLAFSSNLNGHYSIADANVFVLELATGKVNQVSPHWATSEGLAKPLNTGQTTTVTGRIVWYDDDPQVKRDRTDGVTGIARVDQTACSGLINNDGSFEIKNVPVGVPLLIAVHGSMPNLSDGKPRTSGGTLGTTIAQPALLPGNKDLGPVRLGTHYSNPSYTRPSWTDDGLMVNHGGTTLCYRTNYPQDSWEPVEFKQTTLGFAGGFAVSRDSKHVSFCVDSVTGTDNVLMFNAAGKLLWKKEIPDTNLSFTAESMWTREGIWICAAGRTSILADDLYGSPALVVGIPAQKHAARSRYWPQLAGHSLASLATDGTNGFLVTHQVSLKRRTMHGDLWMWEPEADVLTRMTSLKDVICVASYGR